MSSPILWILVPAGLSVILFSLRRTTLVNVVCALAAGLLALLAWVLPLEETIQVGRITIKISETLVVLGRSFTISSGDQPLIMFIYGMTMLWFLGMTTVRLAPGFSQLGLGVVASLIAALAVEPFLFSALLFELAVLLSVPILLRTGEKAGRGVMRFLIFQTLAIPFILIAGWMLSGVETTPTDSLLANRATIMLELGFMFLLGVFPFYSWIPLLAEEVESYLSGFLFILIPPIVFMFILHFLDRYAWLRSDPVIYDSLRLAGVLMVATGGIMAGFQRHLGRMMGYAVIALSGFALISIGLRDNGGINIFILQILPNAFCLWIWSFALSCLRNRSGSLGFQSNTGWLQSFPFLTSCMVLACLSVAGIPLLAGFPVRLSLLLKLMDQSLLLSIWTFAGNLGLILAGLRLLAMVIQTKEITRWKINEAPGEILFSGIGITGMVLISLLPNIVLPPFLALLNGFTRLP